MQETHTSVYVFDYDILQRMGVNMQFYSDTPEEYNGGQEAAPVQRKDEELPF